MQIYTVFIIFFIIAMPVFSKNNSENSYTKISSDQRIIHAINKMENTSAEWAKKAILGKNISNKPIKISFRNLAEFGQQYAEFDALGWKHNKQLYIFINLKHTNAPPQALAALLSHEAVHQDKFCSLEEETYAWSYEADVWMQMKTLYPELKEIYSGEYPLTDRLNILEKLFVQGNYSSDKIREAVYQNAGYQGMPKHSPGF